MRVPSMPMLVLMLVLMSCRATINAAIHISQSVNQSVSQNKGFVIYLMRVRVRKVCVLHVHALVPSRQCECCLPRGRVSE